MLGLYRKENIQELKNKALIIFDLSALCPKVPTQDTVPAGTVYSGSGVTDTVLKTQDFVDEAQDACGSEVSK